MRFLRQLRPWSERWSSLVRSTTQRCQTASCQPLDPTLSSRNNREFAMKATKAIYWTSTILFALVFALTGTLYLVHNPQMVTKLTLLGYPPYVLAILGTAKVLGAVALVFPTFRRLKEWAYAGFVFDFVGAI